MKMRRSVSRKTGQTNSTDATDLFRSGTVPLPPPHFRFIFCFNLLCFNYDMNNQSIDRSNLVPLFLPDFI